MIFNWGLRAIKDSFYVLNFQQDIGKLTETVLESNQVLNVVQELSYRLGKDNITCDRNFKLCNEVQMLHKYITTRCITMNGTILITKSCIPTKILQKKILFSVQRQLPGQKRFCYIPNKNIFFILKSTLYKDEQMNGV